jgi:hypothetical protein
MESANHLAVLQLRRFAQKREPSNSLSFERHDSQRIAASANLLLS